jgi:hypothetical protein
VQQNATVEVRNVRYYDRFTSKYEMLFGDVVTLRSCTVGALRRVRAVRFPKPLIPVQFWAGVMQLPIFKRKAKSDGNL